MDVPPGRSDLEADPQRSSEQHTACEDDDQALAQHDGQQIQEQETGGGDHLAGVEEHAHGREEDAEQYAPQRHDLAEELVGVERAAGGHARQEGADRQRQPERLGRQRGAEHEQEREEAEEIQAAVLRRRGGPLRIESLDLEDPRDDEVLVRIVATGICRTDIDLIDDWDESSQPVVLGHDAVAFKKMWQVFLDKDILNGS